MNLKNVAKGIAFVALSFCLQISISEPAHASGDYMFTGTSRTAPYTGDDGHTWYFDLENGATYTAEQVKKAARVGVAGEWEFSYRGGSSSSSSNSYGPSSSYGATRSYMFTGRSREASYYDDRGDRWTFYLRNGQTYTESEYAKVISKGLASEWEFSAR